MNTTDHRLNERAARAALAAHSTPAGASAHLPGFDAVEAWSQLTRNDPRGQLRHVNPIPALEAAQETARFIIPGDPEWPEPLEDLGPACPLGLWARGTTSLRPLLDRAVAIVGSRAATPTAAKRASAFGSKMSAAGGTVLASLSYGVESAAHRGASTQGARLAVLPCGLDTCFPNAKDPLLRSILAGTGAVVSLYAPHTNPNAVTLEASAQATAALARAVVLVEGVHGSTDMQCAEAAVRMQRPLFALFPSDDEGYSSGNAHLITAGLARPCRDPREVTASLDEEPRAGTRLVTALRAQQLTAWPEASPTEVAQGITVHTASGRRLRITGTGPHAKRTTYPCAEHAGWHAAEPAPTGGGRPIYRSADTDFTADTAALVIATRQWAAQS